MSEPRKLKPKMAFVRIPVSLPDGEIIACIAENSTCIELFLNNGVSLELRFTKTLKDIIIMLLLNVT